MKILYIIIATFLTAFLTTLFFEIDLISKNWLRYGMVVLLVLLEFGVGFYYIRNEINQQKTTEK